MLAQLLKKNAVLFVPLLCLLLALLPVFIVFSKPEIHLFLNSLYSRPADLFYKTITWLGDGITGITVAIVLLFFSFRHSLYIMSGYLATGILVQVFKRYVFTDLVRPVKYFDDSVTLHLVEGVKLLSGRTFPSGHATSAFALFISLGLLVKNPWLKSAFLLIAMLTAYSRVYLSQHFLPDIYGGALLGTMGAVGFYLLFYKNDKPWHNRSLLNVFRDGSSR